MYIWKDKNSTSSNSIKVRRRRRRIEVHVSEHLSKLGRVLLELRILVQEAIVGVEGVVELLDQLVVLIPEANHLRPELVQLLLLPHPGPPRGLPVGDHPPLLPLVDNAHLLLILCLVRGPRVAAHAPPEGVRVADVHELG